MKLERKKSHRFVKKKEWLANLGVKRFIRLERFLQLTNKKCVKNDY